MHALICACMLQYCVQQGRQGWVICASQDTRETTLNVSPTLGGFLGAKDTLILGEDIPPSQPFGGWQGMS